MIRKPAVSGVFYPSDRRELKLMVENFLKKASLEGNESGRAVSFVAPHAGYLYSGQIAAYAYRALIESRRNMGYCTFVVIGPSHDGYAESGVVSLSDWETPLGVVKNDMELSHKIAEECALSTEDRHIANEHSVEVQLPFLQTLFEKPMCSFICMTDQSPRASRAVCDAIIKASKSLKRNVIVIASSDFNHYESAEMAEKKDMQVIEEIIGLDPEKMYKALERTEDTACGYGPIAVAMLFAKERGAEKATLLKYANSGDVVKDYGSVVAYASFSI